MPKRAFLLSCTALCVLVASACGTTEEAAPPREPPAPPPAEERPIPANPAREQETQVTVTEEELVDRPALAAAETAAENAPRGRDTCETAVNALTAMLDAAESESTTGQRLPRPDRTDFLAACRALPAPAQQCFVPTYAFDHDAECQQVLTALPPDKLAAVQAAMQLEPNE